MENLNLIVLKFNCCVIEMPCVVWYNKIKVAR